jgi:hypothetical protein
VGFLAGVVGVNLDEGPGLVATQTLMFLFAGIEGSPAVGQRLGVVYGGFLAGHRRLVRAGLAAYGG